MLAQPLLNVVQLLQQLLALLRTAVREHGKQRVRDGLVLLRELLDTGDLDRAAEVLAAVKVKARKHQDEAIPKMLAELTSRLEGAQALAAAKDALLENPEARSANDLLGRYHVLELGDMEGALPLFDPSLFNYLMVFKWDRQRAVFTPIREPLWNQSITLK